MAHSLRDEDCAEVGNVLMSSANRTPLLIAATILSMATTSFGQGVTVPRVRDSNVGYIDSAIPGNVFRLRYDNGWENLRPTRATFFWAPGGANGPGPSMPETSVDYQDLITGLETLVTDQASVFAEIPLRFLNPEMNNNTGGLGDMNFGAKYAFLADDEQCWTAQFRTYVPTGDYERGLGNSHVSLEPALLGYRMIGERWAVEGELRDWIPITGNDFAGNIIRYGLGIRNDLIETDEFSVVPVAEFVGWTALGGKFADARLAPPDNVQSAVGDTIVNVKVGVRTRIGENLDFYAGYGRPLTGTSWYKNTLRLELRYLY